MVYDFTPQEIARLEKKSCPIVFDRWTIWILVKKKDEVIIPSRVETQGSQNDFEVRA
jgi:hypothetical protein